MTAYFERPVLKHAPTHSDPLRPTPTQNITTPTYYHPLRPIFILIKLRTIEIWTYNNVLTHSSLIIHQKWQYHERLGRLTWKLVQVPSKVRRLRLSTLIKILTHSSLIIHEKWQYHERLGRLTWKLVQVPNKVQRLRLSTLIKILTHSSLIIMKNDKHDNIMNGWDDWPRNWYRYQIM